MAYPNAHAHLTITIETVIISLAHAQTTTYTKFAQMGGSRYCIYLVFRPASGTKGPNNRGSTVLGLYPEEVHVCWTMEFQYNC